MIFQTFLSPMAATLAQHEEMLTAISLVRHLRGNGLVLERELGSCFNFILPSLCNGICYRHVKVRKYLCNAALVYYFMSWLRTISMCWGLLSISGQFHIK
jgi:hypothetical protein